MASGGLDASLLFFREMTAYHRSLPAVGGVKERFISIGSFVVRLSFSSEILFESFGPAFEHVEIPSSEKYDITVSVCAGREKGLPSPPWGEDQIQRRGDVELPGGSVRVFYSGFLRAMSLYSAEEKAAVYWAEEPSSLPAFEKAAPLRVILHWASLASDRLMIHGAGIGETPGGILLTARGGSGKSTVSLLCLQAGLGLAGDDYVMLDCRERRIFSVYASAKLEPEHADRFFPGLRGSRTFPGTPDEKAVFHLHRAFPCGLVRAFPLRAVVIPTLTGEDRTILEPLAAARAVFAAAPSTLLQMPGAGSAELKKMSGVILGLPCYSLKLGRDLSVVPQLLRGLCA